MWRKNYKILNLEWKIQNLYSFPKNIAKLAKSDKLWQFIFSFKVVNSYYQ